MVEMSEIRLHFSSQKQEYVIENTFTKINSYVERRDYQFINKTITTITVHVFKLLLASSKTSR
jgi:hypothetical protein